MCRWKGFIWCGRNLYCLSFVIERRPFWLGVKVTNILVAYKWYNLFIMTSVQVWHDPRDRASEYQRNICFYYLSLILSLLIHCDAKEIWINYLSKKCSHPYTEYLESMFGSNLTQYNLTFLFILLRKSKKTWRILKRFNKLIDLYWIVSVNTCLHSGIANLSLLALFFPLL